MVPMQQWKVSAADKISFQDVSSNAFYYDAVMWAVTHHPVITKGTNPTHFSPDATCTRGQVVTFLWRSVGEPKPASTKNPFEDVSAGAYYYNAVLWAVEEGITTGTSTTTFSPDQGCTRGQVVTFLYRTAEEPSVESVDLSFKDVSGNGFYYDAVLWAAANEVTSGTSATTFSPGNTCTRGQIVTFLYRSKDFLAGIDFSDEEIEQEIETVTDLNQNLSDIESKYTITDNAQETADHVEAVMQEMLDYCSEQKEAGEIVDYKQDGCLIIIQLEIGKFVYEFQPIPGLQGGSSNMNTNNMVAERAESAAEISKKAVLMDDSAGLSRIATVEPFKNEFNVNIYDHAAQAIEDANLGFDFALNADSEEVTVDLVRNLEGYKIIIWNGHGSFAKDDEMHSILGLGELCSKEKNKEYIDYLMSSQLVYFGGGQNDYGKAHYAVTTKFFDECFDSESFKDSLIYLGTCCSAQDPYLELTLINKGAEAVFGYSDPVHPNYNQVMCQTIFEELLKKDADGNTRTAALALSNAKRLYGQRDPYWTSEQEAFLNIISLGILGFDQHAELLLKEKDFNSYRLSDYGGTSEDDENESGTVDLDKANVGDYVTFGHYEQDCNLENGKEAIVWKVLDKKNGRVLLLSKYGLDVKTYNNTSTDVTWETCTLRSWLNSDFLNSAFSSSEKSVIPTVTLSNPDNPKYGTAGGNNTNDQVFLLSLQEMQQYFSLSNKWTDYDGENYDVTGSSYFIGGSKDVITSPTAYTDAQGVLTTFVHDSEGKASCLWWLRSPGDASIAAAFVDYSGHVDARGFFVDYDHYAVRPALWVNLAS